MRIFNGKREAERILSDLKKRISKEKLKPKLAVILVGQDKASKLYIKLKRKAAKKIGIKLVLYKFKEAAVEEDKSSSSPSETLVEGKKKESSSIFAAARVKEEKIIQKIKNLNNNSSVHGVIVQLPLSKKFNPNRIIGTINPKKDVDGFQKNSCFSPVLPSAILFAFKKATKIFKKKKIVALVNSKILGETLKLFLKKEGIKIDYILTKKHSFTELPKEAKSKKKEKLSSTFKIKKVRDKLKRADAIIAILGRPGFIKGDMIKNKVILVDVGITKIGPKKVVGDVDRESAKEKAGFLTPVPGGIGPLTVALLLKNTYLAAKNYGKHS